ncbi:NmrA-like family protein [Macrophomina phaseolina MS6]|uniref:NmrA-like family protein n=1 Tax=Macrophomina phaseolina (strain MS6) TaxID=1126212 RepID=K2RNK5_MACPH|nr:NmrA-like family protein [Macrophomina phaseolina MS6]
MVSAQKLLIDACEAESVPRYLASDYTADYRKLDYGDIPEKDPMKDVLTYLQGKQNVKGVHVLVGLLIETFLGFVSGWDAREWVFRFWGTGEERVWEITSYRTAAEYVAAVALDPTAVGFLKFLGDRKSMAEIADVMQSVYRIKPRLESLGTVAECNQRRLVDGQNDLAKLHA